MNDRAVRDGRQLGDRVYELVRDEILDGTLTEGLPLVQEQLAARYGVSRTPVRHTLARLAQEGLATFVPGAGYAVNVIGVNVISDVYEVRKGLEVMALSTQGLQFSALDLARMELLITETEALSQGDSERLFEVSRSFHYALTAPCPNAYLRETLKTVWENPVQRQITRFYSENPENVSSIARAHRQILDAAREGKMSEVISLLDLCHQAQPHGSQVCER